MSPKKGLLRCGFFWQYCDNSHCSPGKKGLCTHILSVYISQYYDLTLLLQHIAQFKTEKSKQKAIPFTKIVRKTITDKKNMQSGRKPGFRAPSSRRASLPAQKLAENTSVPPPPAKQKEVYTTDSEEEGQEDCEEGDEVVPELHDGDEVEQDEEEEEQPVKLTTRKSRTKSIVWRFDEQEYSKTNAEKRFCCECATQIPPYSSRLVSDTRPKQFLCPTQDCLAAAAITRDNVMCDNPRSATFLQFLKSL